MAINPYSYIEYISYNIKRHEGIPKGEIKSVGTWVRMMGVGGACAVLGGGTRLRYGLCTSPSIRRVRLPARWRAYKSPSVRRERPPVDHQDSASAPAPHPRGPCPYAWGLMRWYSTREWLMPFVEQRLCLQFHQQDKPPLIQAKHRHACGVPVQPGTPCQR